MFNLPGLLAMLVLSVLASHMPALAQDYGFNQKRNNSAGAVFAMTNATEGNEIVVYSRASNGTISRLNNREKTRGLGIGVDTDTQGPLRLSPDNRFLYAVNPGSDNISVFEVEGTRIRFLQIIAAGDQPVSLTIHGNLLYSLDGSVAGNGIRGFRIAPDGTLTELPNSFRMLSSPIAVPGEVKFSPDGRTILVTQKTTNVLLTPQNAIDAFSIGDDGYASQMPIRNASFGLRPFSLAFRNDGKLVVVEAFNAAMGMSATSSYQLNPNGTITVISGSIPNGQTDVCWVLITNDGRYVYAANFGSGTISSYSLSPSGTLTLLNGVAAFLGDMSQPVDIDLSADGRYLYQLLRGTGAVAAFRIEANGALTSLGMVTGGLPVANGASGLAAY
ncbi:MAG TPA: beta-propeller fold lactonase family protein [Pyrinomonadaceae bacterium]|nr:beta-propeller fold lactonase family protein [Pyrinomonadaceae bacterium]